MWQRLILCKIYKLIWVRRRIELMKSVFDSLMLIIIGGALVIWHIE